MSEQGDDKPVGELRGRDFRRTLARRLGALEYHRVEMSGDMELKDNATLERVIRMDADDALKPLWPLLGDSE